MRREVFLEDRTVIVLLLVAGRVDRETLRSVFHLAVGDRLCGQLLERVDPVVAYAVGELFFLTPYDLGGEHVLERFAQDPFFDMPVLGHFRRRVDAHRHVEELLVEERYAPLDTPCRERLVGAQAVVEVQLTDLAHGLLVEGTGVGRLVEIEVAAENLVGTLAREHHLDAHRLDDARQQVHRRRGAYGCHVVGLDIIDHVAHGIQPLLYGVVDFVVYGADMVGDLACRRQVGRPFQSDGERVELRPPGPVAVVRFDAPVGVFLGDGRDDRRVEAARQQYAVGYV